MRIVISAALILLLGWGAMWQDQGDRTSRREESAATWSVRANRGPCDEARYVVRPWMGHEEVARRVRALIRCAVRRWSVPGGVTNALDVARCESGYWPWARGGDNLGVYQHKDDYWRSRVRELLRRDWFGDRQWERIDRDARLHPGAAFLARANVLVAIRMAHRAGWGAWSCA
jgi:hypothetical protein